MSDEYIRKADIINIPLPDKAERNYITYNYDDTYEQGYQEALDKAASLPYADVVQVRHGTWLPIVSYNNTYKCSECGRLLVDITDGLKMVAKHYPYCHCGAKMDKE